MPCHHFIRMKLISLSQHEITNNMRYDSDGQDMTAKSMTIIAASYHRGLNWLFKTGNMQYRRSASSQSESDWSVDESRRHQSQDLYSAEFLIISCETIDLNQSVHYFNCNKTESDSQKWAIRTFSRSHHCMNYSMYHSCIEHQHTQWQLGSIETHFQTSLGWMNMGKGKKSTTVFLQIRLNSDVIIRD